MQMSDDVLYSHTTLDKSIRPFRHLRTKGIPKSNYSET